MQVQQQLASSLLGQFAVPLNISLISKSQDWPTRQKTGYEATKDNIRSEFHGLSDFKDQMKMYSNSLGLIGRIAWQVIQYLVPNNKDVLLTEITVPGMGPVGKFLLSLHGFAQVFSLPPQSLQSVSSTNNLLNSASSSNVPIAG